MVECIPLNMLTGFFSPVTQLKKEVLITFENTYYHCKKHSVMSRMKLIQNDFNPQQILTSNLDENQWYAIAGNSIVEYDYIFPLEETQCHI